MSHEKPSAIGRSANETEKIIEDLITLHLDIAVVYDTRAAEYGSCDFANLIGCQRRWIASPAEEEAKRDIFDDSAVYVLFASAARADRE